MTKTTKKKPSKKTLRNKADRLFSLIVRARGWCERCGKVERLQAAHIVPRKYLSVRWSEENALCLCSACHVYFTHFPLEFTEFVEEHMGAEAYRDLRIRAMRASGAPDYDAVLEGLETRLTEVQA